jgi:Uma2 family endonuclease
MNIQAQPFARQEVIYPESDGLPMAENTEQFEYIVTIHGNLADLYRDDPNVFVASDLFWYPVEGDPTIRTAPDAMVAFGQPKGHRGSYRQWEEGGIAPQVVFEVWSPSNRPWDMVRLHRFYEKYGVEEFYVFDPESGDLIGYLREGTELQEIPQMLGWISPRLGIRFEVEDKQLRLYRPDGTRFPTFLELAEGERQQRKAAEQQREEADRQRKEAEQQRKEADRARERAERLEAQLRALGIEPEA